jgi:hypothetical protein
MVHKSLEKAYFYQTSVKRCHMLSGYDIAKFRRQSMEISKEIAPSVLSNFAEWRNQVHHMLT